MTESINKQVAKTVGPKSALSRWERGEADLPVEVFEKVIATLNISYSEIIINEVEIKQLLAVLIT